MSTSQKPDREGWYWFLPNDAYPIPSVVHVAVLLNGQFPKLIAEFPSGPVPVDNLAGGDWERIEVPHWMFRKALAKILDFEHEWDSLGIDAEHDATSEKES